MSKYVETMSGEELGNKLLNSIKEMKTGKAARVTKFADKHTKSLYESGTSKKFPPDIHARTSRKLEYVNLASTLDDLKVPPGNKLHKLTDDREGLHAIAINDQWRICFRFDDGDAFDVQVCDYH